MKEKRFDELKMILMKFDMLCKTLQLNIQGVDVEKAAAYYENFYFSLGRKERKKYQERLEKRVGTTEYSKVSKEPETISDVMEMDAFALYQASLKNQKVSVDNEGNLVFEETEKSSKKENSDEFCDNERKLPNIEDEYYSD